ncbi:MAG: hypothetical protein U0575_13965 [Phycisphaerales bacterium]|jgi:hypothetical protein
MLTRASINLFAIVAGLTARAATAGFVEFEDAGAWFAAAGPTTTIDFVLGTPQVLNNQYVGMGVVFPDGNDVAFAAATFNLDGWGVQGAPGVPGAVVAQLLEAHHAIGFVYHGNIVCKLYANDQLVYSSTLFGAQGTDGAFAGIVSTVLFDRVVVTDPLDGQLFVDNMYFDAVPGPTASVLIAGWLVGGRRRRA